MPQLTYAVVRRGVDDQVVGVTVNNCRLFVLRYPNHQQIEVYDTTLWSRASKRAQRPLCFCAVFSYSFFFYFFFFFFFFFFLFSLSRNL
jgi:hypothetical protein